MYGPPCSKLRERSPDDVIQPKRVGNLDHNASKSSLGTYPKEVRLCPLELRPVLNQETKIKDGYIQGGPNASLSGVNKQTLANANFHSKHYKVPRRARLKQPYYARSPLATASRCSNTPDVYRHILGPTADESILAGLQTVIDICGLIDYCHSDSEISNTSTEHEKTENHSAGIKYDRVTSPYGPNVFDSYAVTHKPSREKKSPSRKDTSISNVDETFMTAKSGSGSPSMDKSSPYETPTSSFVETSTPNRRESIPILKRDHTESHSKDRNHASEKDVSFATPPVYRNNSPVPSTDERSPSEQPVRRKLFPNNSPPVSPRPSYTDPHSNYEDSQHPIKDSPVTSYETSETIRVGDGEETGSAEPVSSGASWCKIDECCGTARDSVPCVTVKTKDGRHICIKYRCKSIQSSLSAKCFPPVEIPPCDFSCGKCTTMQSGIDLSKLNIPFSAEKCTCSASVASLRKRLFKCRQKKESKSVVIQDPKAGVSLVFDPRYTCNRNYQPNPRKPPHRDFRLSRTIPPAVQPVVGVCTEGRCAPDATGGGGERLLEVRYAFVRISVFPSYTTYEIMKSSKKKPKKVPESVEGIFVTKR